jgi:hypothetical protein
MEFDFQRGILGDYNQRGEGLITQLGEKLPGIQVNYLTRPLKPKHLRKIDLLAHSLHMDSLEPQEPVMEKENVILTEMFLRTKLVKLALDWELKALDLDAARYRTPGPTERENLRETALTYRRCIADLSSLMNLGANQKPS